MAELVDAPDLKSVEYCTRAGSIPAVGIIFSNRPPLSSYYGAKCESFLKNAIIELEKVSVFKRS